jgi:DNA repair protein RecO (recombination protein O)
MGRKLQIDNESYNQLKNLLFFLIENSIDGKLNSLITGAGIL